jgi:hypothetical protein
MCADASTVLKAVAADFFFNCWYLEIPSDNRIRHIPRCVHYRAQGFRLETLGMRADIVVGVSGFFVEYLDVQREKFIESKLTLRKNNALAECLVG